MSISSYTTAPRVRSLYRKIIETAGITLDEMEFFGDEADGYINGLLARRYAVPFRTSSLSPIEPIRSLATKLWAANILISRVALDNVEWMDIALRYKEEVKNELTDIVSGNVDIVGLADNVSSAFVIGPKSDPRNEVWSSTSTYKPTFDVRPMEEQRVDLDRIDAEADADT